MMEFSHCVPSMVTTFFMEPTLDDEMIDPALGQVPAWHQPDQMQRYLTEQSRNPLIVPGSSHLDPTLAGNFSRHTDPVHAIPASAYARYGSPFSYQPSDTTCSAISPRMDSDIMYDHNPPTPPDLNLFPYQGNIHYGTEAPLAKEHQLAGLVPFHSNSYVKPMEVNPSQAQSSLDDLTKPHFEPLHRGFSSSSEESQFGISQLNKYDVLEVPRQMSPEDDLDAPKDEIRIPDPQSPRNFDKYPALESEDEEQSEQDFDLAPRDRDDEDEDYSPNSKKKYTRTNSTAGRASRGRKRAIEAPTSPAKKSRINVEITERITPVLPQRGSLRCNECRTRFPDQSGLDRHIKASHTRSFVCVFSFAGCTSTFASKNEWKRHATTQHLRLLYWVCDQDACSKVSNSSKSAPCSGRTNPSSGRNIKAKHFSNSHARTSAADAHPSNSLPNGAIFNRKDLFTQHVRRMHVPPQIKKQIKLKKPVPDLDAHIKNLQDSSLRERCKLPEYMLCPAQGCNTQFRGVNAWDDRMEHVAKHLEKAAAGEEPPVVFGGDEDHTLTLWASHPDVAVIRKDEKGSWVENNPIRGAGGTGASRKEKSSRHSAIAPIPLPLKHEVEDDDTEVKKEIVVETSEEDAEGEFVDDDE